MNLPKMAYTEETENIEVLEYPFQTAIQMVKTGDIRDAKTILLLHYAALNGLFDTTN